VHLVLVKNQDGSFRALPVADGEHFARLAAREERRRKPAAVSVTLAQEQAFLSIKDELVRTAERRSALELDLARERADRYCEDCLLEGREALDKAREAWAAARRPVTSHTHPAERARARAHSDKLERDYRKRLASVRNEEERRYAAKDRSLADLAQKAKVTERRSLVASAYFWLS
jgi:hypothetical protein